MIELERVEREGYRAIVAAAPADLAEELGLATADVGGATCISVRAVDSTMLNRACGLGVARAATEDDLDVIGRFFGDLGVRYAVALAPGACPPQLEGWLRERGFEPGYAWMKFRRRAQPPPAVETDLLVEEIEADRGADMGRVAIEAYGMPERLVDWWTSIATVPECRCFVAYDGDEPAASGFLYVSGKTGWLGGAGTRPAFRRRGGQGAVLAARLRAAAELGLVVLATETGERVPDRPGNSYRNILRFGFEEAYLRPNFLSPE